MRFLACSILAGMLMILTPGLAWSEAQPAFSEEELLRFINDVPGFLQWNHTVPMAEKSSGDRQGPVINFDQRQRDFISKMKWDPDRFIYIYNRVILGGIIADMEGFGGEKLQYMLEQREKLIASQSLGKSEKEKELARLDKAIADLRVTSQTCNSISHGELILMWSHRDALRQVMLGKVPVKPKVMRRY